MFPALGIVLVDWSTVFFFFRLLFFLIDRMDAGWPSCRRRHPECVSRCPLVVELGTGQVTGQLSCFWFGFWGDFFFFFCISRK